MTTTRSLAVQFSDFLHKQESKIASALPAHVTPGRMIAATVACFNASKELQKCGETEIGRASIMQSVMISSVVGLEPGVLGQAYLIPYYNDKLKSYICTFVPGWKGIVSVVGRSGKGMVRANAAFEGDDFDYDLGTGMFIKHKPKGKTRHADKITHVYAIGEIAGLSDRIIEVWEIAQVHEHFKKYNKVGAKHYAHKNWEMYARKIPLLQVAKLLPQTVEITHVTAAAYTAERNESLIVDEQGVPLNAGYDNGPAEEPPKKEPIRQPRRKDADDVAPKVAADPNPLASEGQINYLKKKAGTVGVLKAAMKKAGVPSIDNLTLDGFNAIKDALK